MKDNIINESKVYKELYGFELDTTPLLFRPLGLIELESFDILIKSNPALVTYNETEEGKIALANVCNVFSTNGCDSIFENNIMNIRLPGIEEIIPISLTSIEVSTKILKPHLNLIFKHGCNFYGITSSCFKGNIKRHAYSEEDKKIQEHLILSILQDSEDIGIFEILEFRPVKTSIGRILTVLLPGVKSSTVSDIVTYIKATTKAKIDEKINPNISIIEGDAITYFYNQKNYIRGNEGTTLGNSCMRGNSNTESLRFYDDNPNVIQLIVYVKDKKIEGRALLWKTITNSFIVDRIYYTTNDIAIEIAKFCKIKGFKTCYSSNNHNYGIERANPDEILVKLDQIDNREYQPFFDSMRYIDIVNGIISTNTETLAKHGKNTNQDYVVFKLDGFQSGSMFRRRPWDDDRYPIKVGKATEHQQICDAEGNYLQDFRDITIIQRPFKGIMSRKKTVTLQPNNVVTASFFVRELIHKYNCIRTIVTINKNLEIKLADKKDTVYSHFHQSHILKKDSIFLKDINSYALKQVYENEEFKNQIKLLKIKRLFVGKLVHVRPEGITYLQKQFALLPEKLSLSCIRPSRTFMVKKDNTTVTSIILKGIPVPIKYIKIIKIKQHGQN